MLRMSIPRASVWPALVWLLCSQPASAAVPEPARQAELIRLLRQDCGSCHGMTLKGGLGPALLPASLNDKPAEGLTATIYHGRPGTPMPPWKQFMSEAEAAWLVELLMSGTLK
jgi:cytochrome c55X